MRPYYRWYFYSDCIIIVSYMPVAVSCCMFLFFFFKQKTAYEMRISDWSSDVCSSDLVGEQALAPGFDPMQPRGLAPRRCAAGLERVEIGRASWRERVCQYV